MSIHDPVYRAFLVRLKLARVEAGLSQVEAAERLGKHQTYVSKCERGERRVDIAELLEFAGLYGKTLDYFTATRAE